MQEQEEKNARIIDLSGALKNYKKTVLQDNDSNKYYSTSSSCLTCGVNADVYWCNGEGGSYLRVAPLVDKIIDGGDGNIKGKFFWFNIAKNSSE